MDRNEIIKKINSRPYEEESEWIRENLEDGVIRSIRKKLKDEYKLLTKISIERLKDKDSLLINNHEFITA